MTKVEFEQKLFTLIMGQTVLPNEKVLLKCSSNDESVDTIVIDFNTTNKTFGIEINNCYFDNKSIDDIYNFLYYYGLYYDGNVYFNNVEEI